MAKRSRDSKGRPRKDRKAPDGTPLLADGTKRPGKARRPLGRRSRIHEPGLADDIIARLERGHTLADAAQGAGVSKAAFLEWRRRGEEALQAVEAEGVPGDLDLAELLPDVPERERVYVIFADRAARAIASARGRLHDVVLRIASKAASDDPREVGHALKAATWMLERRWPETYGQASRLELQGNEERPVALQVFLPQLQAGTDDVELMRRSRGQIPAKDDEGGER
jgi:hypothetical protein